MWQQYALSLMAAGRPERALFVLEEAVRLNPGQTALLLLAARTCYQNLHRVRPHTGQLTQGTQTPDLLPEPALCETAYQTHGL